MEWQARTIAPKILMPSCTVRMILSKRLNNVQNGTIRVSTLKAVVKEIAEIYKVSRQSAAIRVSELGYPEAVELYGSEIVDIDYRHRRSSTSSKFHQQPIDEVSAFQLYMSSEFLKTTLNTGAFCCAEEYFVICDEKYVLPGEGAWYKIKKIIFNLKEISLHKKILTITHKSNDYNGIVSRKNRKKQKTPPHKCFAAGFIYTPKQADSLI